MASGAWDPANDATATADRPTTPPWPEIQSQALEDWKHQKKLWKQSNPHVDTVMGMIGLEHIKAEFSALNSLVRTMKKQRLDLAKGGFNAIFVGNTATGKTTVAKLYASYLHSVEAIPHDKILSISAISLDTLGVQGVEQTLGQLDLGGALILEEVHHIPASGSSTTHALFHFLLSKVEELRGKVTFILTGYGKHMETFCSTSPALPSLFPKTLRFPDYEAHDLFQLLIRELKSASPKKKLTVEGGYTGIYMRVVARRLARASGKHGFGNVREVQNAVATIRRRQAARLFQARKAGTRTGRGDHLVLTREDLIGPPPSATLGTSKAWKTLKDLIGLQAVKNTVQALMHTLQSNYTRELAEKPLVQCSLNKLFLGNPGTGKTTVATLYGQILVDMGLLSNGEVVVKKPYDFVGDALGASERNTLAILDATKGKVLVIDEAYSLLGGLGGRQNQGGGAAGQDQFRSSVIDTLVGEIQGAAGEDRCVLLLGYRDKMESMLNESNEGLARRFPLATAFDFEDYNPTELRDILKLKLRQQAFRADEEAMDAACEELERSRNRPGFGNAGEVDILLDKAKIRQHERMMKPRSGAEGCDPYLLTADDFDPDFGRGGSRSLLDVWKLFSDFVGCDDIVEKLEGFQRVVRNMKAMSDHLPQGMGWDPRSKIPFSFIFCGPPGTGKTSTARKMGELFYDLGFLSTKEVLERSATDLIGEYVGHTGPKTKRLFDAALGRVLLIDEAYKLADGVFGKEAVVEMINCLSQSRYQNKLVVILAGYEHDINKLMHINEGLSSRFGEVIRFKPPNIQECITLLFSCLRTSGLGIAAIETSEMLHHFLAFNFEQLSRLPSWGAARDIHTLARMSYLSILKTCRPQPSLDVDEDTLRDAVTSMLLERQSREATTRGSRDANPSDGTKQPCATSPLYDSLERTTGQPTIIITASVGVKRKLEVDEKMDEPRKERRVTELPDTPKSNGPDEPGAENDDGIDSTPRDPGVTDQVWDDLRTAKKAARQRQLDVEKSHKEYHLTVGAVQNAKAKLALSTSAPQEQQRLQNQIRMAEKIAAEQKKRLEEKEKEEEREGEIQSRLAGVCPYGYSWIKEDQGYRCAGGMHFVGMEQIQSGDWELTM